MPRWARAGGEIFHASPPTSHLPRALKHNLRLNPEVGCYWLILFLSEFDPCIQLDRARVAGIVELTKCRAGDVERRSDELVPVKRIGEQRPDREPPLLAEGESLIESDVFIEVAASSHRRQDACVCQGESRRRKERGRVQVPVMTGNTWVVVTATVDGPNGNPGHQVCCGINGEREPALVRLDG